MKGLFLLFLIFFAACSRDTNSEKEPNNSFSEANPVQLNKPFKGYVNSAADRDFYRLTVEEEAVLSVNLSGVKGINLALRLWGGGPEPVLLKQIDDSRKSSSEFFPNLYVNRGDYFIEVIQGDKDQKSANTENPYTLTLSLRPLINEETEPNDSSDYATPLNPGNEIAGLYSPSFNPLNDRDPKYRHREEDWFSFHTDAGPDSPVQADISVSGVPAITPQLALFGPDKTLIAEVSGRAPGEGALIKGVGIKNSGTCYVRVASSGFTSNSEVQYLLNVQLSEYSSDNELEPNNSFEAANTVSGGTIRGTLNGSGDVDYFVVQNEGEKTLLRVELIPEPGIDAVVTVYSENRKKIAEIDNAGTGEPEIHPNLFVKGRVYLAVKARTGGDANNGYQLAVSAVENPVTDREPNDSKSLAQPVKSSEITGYTSHKGDTDYYLFEYEKRRRMEFSVRGGKESVIKVSVTDPMGYIIKTVESRKGKEVVLKEFIDRKGFLIVESAEEDYTNPYTIKIRSSE